MNISFISRRSGEIKATATPKQESIAKAPESQKAQEMTL